MSIFQKAYDAIRNWSAPTWLKVLIQSLNDIMISVLKQVSKSYIDYLKSKIIEASNMDMTNRERFDYVFKAAKSGFVDFAVTLKDSELNAIIEFLYLQIKKARVID